MRPEACFGVVFAGVGATVFVIHLWRGLTAGRVKTVDFSAPSFERRSQPIRYWAWMAIYAALALVLMFFVAACLIDRL